MRLDIDRAYEILELKPNASPQEIKQAYRRLAKIWHPDSFLEPQQKLVAEEKIKEINQAYDKLKFYQAEGINQSSQFHQTSHQTKVDAYTSNAETFYKRGMENAQRGRYTEAIEDFTQAIRLNPNYFEAYQYRGLACSKLGYENRAKSDLKNAAQLELQQKITQPKPASSPPKSPTSEVKTQASPWKCVNTFNHLNWVFTTVISPDGQLLASGSSDNTVKIWHLQTGKLLHTLNGHTKSVRCLAFSPNSRTLVSGSNDSSIMVWQVSTGQLVNTLKVHSTPVVAVAISSDGQTLFSGGKDTAIKISHIAMGQLLHVLKGHSDVIHSLAICSQQDILVSGSGDRTIKIWNWRNKKLLHTLTGHSSWVNCVAISPDEQIIASGSYDQTIKLWNMSTGKLINTLTDHRSYVWSVAFSPDGEYVASGSADQTVRMWHVKTQQPVYTLGSHSDWVNSIAFSPDGKTFVSGSRDMTVKVWQ
jgi:WD40 repeat protein